MTVENNLPEQISPHMRQVLCRIRDAGDTKALAALEKQLFASSAEQTVLPCETADPLGAHRYQVTPRAVHQYKNRILLLTTGRCFSNCRYCFRRCSDVRGTGFITAKEAETVCAYLEQHPEVQEILFSGGDCLTGTDEALAGLVSAFRKAHAGSTGSAAFTDRLLIRICTRAPVFAPERVTPRLIELFRSNRPLWVIPHINHPAEISEVYSPETVRVLGALVDAGIPVQSQTVLLRGVNDSVDVLAELFRKLTAMGIKPGYLFQGDLAPGTSHFRVPIQEGVRLYESLRRELSGLSTPVYAVDLPGGGGKVNLMQLDPDLMDVKVRKDGGAYRFTDRDGNRWSYPC
jgi:lysine 2,3-aminomutase